MTHQTSEQYFDTVVIGGGQTGLAMGYFLARQDRDFVILGCTEITMLVGQEDVSVPLFDTTRIHAEKAVKIALDARELDTRFKRSPEATY